MKVYTVVGVKRVSGTSRKDGQPFSLTKLQLTYEDPSDKSLIGCGVHEEMPFDRVFKSSGYEPTVGDKIQLFYEPDFNGKAQLAYIQRVK